MRVPHSVLSESAQIIGWTAGNGPAAYSAITQITHVFILLLQYRDSIALKFVLNYINTVRLQLDQIVHLLHYILLHWPRL
jgi:hypothetical protein